MQKIIAIILVLLVAAFAIYYLYENEPVLKPPSPIDSLKKNLKFDVISTEAIGAKMVQVNVKVTNLGNRHINQAEIACILHDINGHEIAFAKHYVIRSLDGGLPGGQLIYFEYVINANYSQTKSVSFHIDSIK